MAIERLTLTPTIAQGLLANLYDKQRKPNRQKVNQYKQALERGEWVSWNPDAPILIDKGTGAMFNGLQRCTAVVESGISMEVLYDADSDGKYFDYIDTGLTRRAQQFITGTAAVARASASRTIIWYREDFETRPNPAVLSYPLDRVLRVAAEFETTFDALVVPTRTSYNMTGISQSIQLAACSLAVTSDFPMEQVTDFLARIANPNGLAADDPAWRLYVRSNNRVNVTRHRDVVSNWTIFVRHLNAALTGDPLPHHIVSSMSVWPRIGETEAKLGSRLTRRANVAYDARKRQSA